MFPNAKFLFVVRDGRAVVHNLLQRTVGLNILMCIH